MVWSELLSRELGLSAACGILGHHPAQGTFVCIKATGNPKRVDAYKRVKKKQPSDLHLVVTILVPPTPSLASLPCLQSE